MMKMEQLVQNFPKQLEQALYIGQEYEFQGNRKNFNQIVLTGLGGSGIGGSIVQNYVSDKIQIPFWVNKDYDLPAFVDENTLLLACSYSGDTEETLMAAAHAHQKGATVVGITSGGKLLEFAHRHHLDCIVIPGGMPPRSCLGFSIVQILTVLNFYGFIDSRYQQEILAALRFMENQQSALQQKGRDLAAFLYGKMPIIYSSGRFEGLAVRFRQQLNENSKVLCWHAVIPEMNHNELVGWRDDAADKAVVILRSPQDSERVQYRMDINKEVFAKYTPHIDDLYAVGESYWEELFSLVHITDWCSVFLAEMRNMDALEVEVINSLKAQLNEKPVI